MDHDLSVKRERVVTISMNWDEFDEFETMIEDAERSCDPNRQGIIKKLRKKIELIYDLNNDIRGDYDS